MGRRFRYKGTLVALVASLVLVVGLVPAPALAGAVDEIEAGKAQAADVWAAAPEGPSSAGDAEKDGPAVPSEADDSQGADDKEPVTSPSGGTDALGGEAEQAEASAEPSPEPAGSQGLEAPVDAATGPDAGPSSDPNSEASHETIPELTYPVFDQSKAVDGVTVRVSASEGVFPDGAELSVAAVPDTQIEAAVAAERDDDANVAERYTFDIKVLDEDGTELQPASGKHADISFCAEKVASPNLDIGVYHITGDGAAEVLDVSLQGQTAVAETSGFSYYRVEFTYGDLQYVLPGDRTVALRDVLDAVGIVGEASAVTCSDERLFSASDDTGEWVVSSHAPFTSTEWMKVTVAGVEYEITVTDGGVLFFCAASGSKTTAAVGSGDFGELVASSEDGMKATIVDDERAPGFSVGIVGAPEGTTEATASAGGDLAITYENAVTGDKQYVSALLFRGSNRYYASLTPAESGSGTWTLALPNELETGAWSLVVFSEQQSGDHLTDYASPYARFSLTIASEHAVTVVGGTADKATAKEGDTVTITADEPEDGVIFNQWSLNDTDVSFQSADAWQTTFTMPAHDVTIEAVFRNIVINDTLPDVTYTGEAFEPTFSFFGVQVEGAGVLWPGSNYSLSYEDNVNVGEAKVILTVTDNRKGSKTVTFNIKPADISEATVEVDDQVYAGAGLKPAATVTWNGRTLEEGKDYTLSTDGYQAGDRTLTVAGIGNFEGKATVTFKIAPKPLTITAKNQACTYNGRTQGEGDTVYEDPAEIAGKVSVEGLAEGDTLTSVTLDGQGKDAGTYEIAVSDVRVENTAGDDVTGSYAIDCESGTLTIKQTYTVRWLDGDGSVLQEKAYVEGEPAPVFDGEEPTRTSTVQYVYAFSGWGEGAVDGATTTYEPLFDATVRSYDITFDLAGGTFDGETGTVTWTREYGAAITLPAPTREGYAFRHWEGSRYDAGDEYTVEGGHAFTAVWEKETSPDSTPDKPKPGNPASPHTSIPQTGDPHAGTALALTVLAAMSGICLVLAGLSLRRKRGEHER